MANKLPSSGYVGSLPVSVKKDFYNGLWNIVYDHGSKWAGPYKTKREASEHLAREQEYEKHRRLPHG